MVSDYGFNIFATSGSDVTRNLSYTETHDLWPMLTNTSGHFTNKKPKDIKTQMRNNGKAVMRQPEPLPGRIRTIIYITVERK